MHRTCYQEGSRGKPVHNGFSLSFTRNGSVDDVYGNAIGRQSNKDEVKKWQLASTENAGRKELIWVPWAEYPAGSAVSSYKIETVLKELKCSDTTVSIEGHDHIVQMLLDNRSDVNAQGERYGNALSAASAGGHDWKVQILSIYFIQTHYFVVLIVAEIMLTSCEPTGNNWLPDETCRAAARLNAIYNVFRS